VFFRSVDATGSFFVNASQTFEFDSKGMRKFTEDQTVVVMVENAAAAHGCVFNINFRMLLKVN